MMDRLCGDTMCWWLSWVAWQEENIFFFVGILAFHGLKLERMMND
jgi:hypothetical protein